MSAEEGEEVPPSGSSSCNRMSPGAGGTWTAPLPPARVRSGSPRLLAPEEGVRRCRTAYPARRHGRASGDEAAVGRPMQAHAASDRPADLAGVEALEHL